MTAYEDIDINIHENSPLGGTTKKKQGITLRAFLATTVAGSAAVLASSYLPSKAWVAQEKVPPGVKITPTLCDGCGNWCALNVYNRGDSIWKAEGNPIAGKNFG